MHLLAQIEQRPNLLPVAKAERCHLLLCLSRAYSRMDSAVQQWLNSKYVILPRAVLKLLRLCWFLRGYIHHLVPNQWGQIMFSPFSVINSNRPSAASPQCSQHKQSWAKTKFLLIIKPKSKYLSVCKNRAKGGKLKPANRVWGFNKCQRASSLFGLQIIAGWWSIILQLAIAVKEEGGEWFLES